MLINVHWKRENNQCCRSQSKWKTVQGLVLARPAAGHPGSLLLNSFATNDLDGMRWSAMAMKNDDDHDVVSRSLNWSSGGGTNARGDIFQPWNEWHVRWSKKILCVAGTGIRFCHVEMTFEFRVEFSPTPAHDIPGYWDISGEIAPVVESGSAKRGKIGCKSRITLSIGMPHH